MRQTAGPKTLILGLGNPLSGDDGFGARVLDLLRQEEKERPPNAALADAHTDLLSHIDDFAGYDRVVLVDAILDPENKLGQPGQIVVLQEEEFLPWSEVSSSIHQMSPLLTVKLFRKLFPGCQNQIVLVGLIVDQLAHTVLYATQDRIQFAAATIRNLSGE